MFPNAQYDVKILSDAELYHKVKTYIKDKRTKRIVHTLLTPTQTRYVKTVMKSRRLPNFLSSLLETYAGQVELAGSFKWGYWVTEESTQFEKYIHKLIKGRESISDLDIIILNHGLVNQHEYTNNLLNNTKYLIHIIYDQLHNYYHK